METIYDEKLIHILCIITIYFRIQVDGKDHVPLLDESIRLNFVLDCLTKYYNIEVKNDGLKTILSSHQYQDALDSYTDKL